MPMEVVCPWCATVSNLPRTGAVYCKQCHHRADVHRESCDCLTCARPPWDPREELPPIPELPPLPAPGELFHGPRASTFTADVRLDGEKEPTARAVWSAGAEGACLVFGLSDDPLSKITVQWEREQLVHLVCTMLPYLAHVELMRVVEECRIH